MDEMNSRPPSAKSWESLAEVFAASRQVSADLLIEWPAQRQLCGEVSGKNILDVGCGTGDKARYFAEHGAHSVIGIDASSGFAQAWQSHAACPKLQLVHGDFEQIASLPPVAAKKFDLIVCFQALMYARDVDVMVATLAQLLAAGGALVFSVPHPFRFAILKNEIEGWGHGFAYQQTGPYRYPSPWKPEVALEHGMPRVSDYLNAISAAGLRVTACEEPGVTEEFRARAPEKAAWMDRYVGILIVRAESGPQQESKNPTG
ncbi:MAG TPA: class I SAM-dependent methyltransferase [Acidobacteriaceae bacterium]|nr:class I SAM-dependent methyltransferase [Acidobacteriaceae bacterium]